MVQIYFLSIVLNIIGGLVLSSKNLENKYPLFKNVNEFFEDKKYFYIIIAILSFFVGILKILSVISGDVKIVGDLLPALAGIAVGITLMLDYFKERSKTEVVSESSFDKFLFKNKLILGIASIIIGIVHFFMPGVLFL